MDTPPVPDQSSNRSAVVRRRTSVGRKLLRIGLVLLLVSLSSFSLAFFHQSLKIDTRDLSRWAKPFLPELKDQYVFLLMGTDAKIDINRTDTLILVFLDTRRMNIHTLSILRDTYIEWLKKENRKINAVYAYAWFKEQNDRKAMAATREAVERLLAIKIDYSIKVDLGAFVRIIDLIGGVDIYVDKDMKYDDFKQNLHINLKKGHQHLDGEKAQQFVRFRRDADGDRTRAGRQQRFMRAVVQQLTRPSVMLRLPDILRGVLREIVTDLEFDVALALANRFLEGGRPVVDTHLLPGEFKRIGELDYFVHDPRRTEELLKFFLEGSGETEFADTVEFINLRAKIVHKPSPPPPAGDSRAVEVAAPRSVSAPAKPRERDGTREEPVLENPDSAPPPPAPEAGAASTEVRVAPAAPSPEAAMVIRPTLVSVVETDDPGASADKPDPSAPFAGAGTPDTVEATLAEPPIWDEDDDGDGDEGQGREDSRE